MIAQPRRNPPPSGGGGSQPLHQAVIDAIRGRLALDEDDEDLKTALAVLTDPDRVDLIWDRMLGPCLDEIINRTCLLGRDR